MKFADRCNSAIALTGTAHPSKASDSRQHKPRKPFQAFVSLALAYSQSFLDENSAQRPAETGLVGAVSCSATRACSGKWFACLP